MSVLPLAAAAGCSAARSAAFWYLQRAAMVGYNWVAAEITPETWGKQKIANLELCKFISKDAVLRSFFEILSYFSISYFSDGPV